MSEYLNQHEVEDDETPHYHKKGKTDCWPWLRDPAKAPNKGALMACRNDQCMNPRHIVKSAEEYQAEREPDAEKDQLKAKLDAAEIPYRANASLDALQALIEEHGL